MPEDITLEVGYDRTQFVRKAIFEVKETLIIAVFLVVLIIYLFFVSGPLPFAPLLIFRFR
jgi:multidrug efflux pump